MPRLALLDPTKTGTQAEELENKLRQSDGRSEPFFPRPYGLRKDPDRGGHSRSLSQESKSSHKDRLRRVST